MFFSFLVIGGILNFFFFDNLKKPESQWVRWELVSVCGWLAGWLAFCSLRGVINMAAVGFEGQGEVQSSFIGVLRIHTSVSLFTFCQS